MTAPALAVAGAVAAGAAAALVPRPFRPLVPLRRGQPVSLPDDRGWLHRGRLLWAGLGGLAAYSFLGGPLGAAIGAGVAVWVWLVATRAESPLARAAREAARRDLPHLVGLMADALRGGQPAVEALAVASTALPGER